MPERAHWSSKDNPLHICLQQAWTLIFHSFSMHFPSVPPSRASAFCSVSLSGHSWHLLSLFNRVFKTSVCLHRTSKRNKKYYIVYSNVLYGCFLHLISPFLLFVLLFPLSTFASLSFVQLLTWLSAKQNMMDDTNRLTDDKVIELSVKNAESDVAALKADIVQGQFTKRAALLAEMLNETPEYANKSLDEIVGILEMISKWFRAAPSIWMAFPVFCLFAKCIYSRLLRAHRPAFSSQWWRYWVSNRTIQILVYLKIIIIIIRQ